MTFTWNDMKVRWYIPLIWKGRNVFETPLSSETMKTRDDPWVVWNETFDDFQLSISREERCDNTSFLFSRPKTFEDASSQICENSSQTCEDASLSVHTAEMCSNTSLFIWKQSAAKCLSHFEE